MNKFKILFPIILGFLIAFGMVGGLALPSGATAAPRSPTATIVYVNANAPGPGHDGLSWTTAYTTLQDALMVVISGTEIWVAEGIYYPDEGAGQTNDRRESTFTLLDEVALYGGFAATETLRSQRDWEAHVTVLSGDIDHETSPDITDPNGVVGDTDNLQGNNAVHVVTSNGVTTTAVLDGFSITAGQANGVAHPISQGGGIYNEGGSPSLANMIFSGNLAYHHGGGMFNFLSSSPSLTNVTFLNNSAGGWGGGIDNHSYCNPVLTNVTFSGNSAVEKGGGMRNYRDSNAILNNVTFLGNSSDIGGGMYNDFGSNPVLNNATFVNNSAHHGGGMYNEGNSDPILNNVTFSGNWAAGGGGIFNLESSPMLNNTIMWNNSASTSGSQIYNASSIPIIRYSDIDGSGGSGAGWDPSLGSDGGGNIDANPLFLRDPDHFLQDYGDLRLQPGAPVIDVGTNSDCPATDLDGDLRPVNGTCDMGAYEAGYTLALSKLVDDPTPAPGQTITFTIVITNGELDVLGGVISDALPAGLNFLGPVTLDPPDAGLVGIAPPILAANLTISYAETVTLTFPVTVSDGLNAGTQLVNTAALSSAEVITPVIGSVTLTITGVQDNSFIYLPLMVR